MSDANLQVGIDGRGAQSGASTVVRSLNDIINAANSVNSKLKSVESNLAKLGVSNSGLSQAKQKINELNASSNNFHKLLTSIEDRFIRISATALGLWVVKQIFDALVTPLRSSVQYLAQIEIASLGIASSLMVTGNYVDQISGKVIKGQQALKLAQQESKDIIDQLKVANINTIATLDELIVAYQTALPIAMARGFDKKQVLDFTLAMVQAAGAIGLPFNQMSEEIRSLLTEGAINPRNSRIATVLGLRNEDLLEYKNNAQGLFNFLMSKLEGFTVAGQQSQNTMKGIWSNIIDVAKQLGGTAFEGVFTGLKTQLKSLLDDIVTFDSVAKTANWNKDWVEGAKNLNEWLTTTFHTLVSVSKSIIEHRDLILTLVKAYIAYQVVTLSSVAITKLWTALHFQEIGSIVAKELALIKLGVTKQSIMTLEQHQLVMNDKLNLSTGRSLTIKAERVAVSKAEVIAINQGIQAKIKEQEQTIQDIQVTRWEIGLEQDLIASKISQQRANAELLVQERLLAESRVASASAYSISSVETNGVAWSKDALAIEKTERDLLAAAVARETEAKMALASTMIRLNGLEAGEVSLKASQIATQQALLKSKVEAIEMDNAATIATDRYNAALAANDQALLAVTKAQVTKVQTDWVYMSDAQKKIAFEIAETEAIAANTAGKYASSAANRILTTSSKLLNGAFMLIGGTIGLTIIAIGSMIYAIKQLAEEEEKYRSGWEKTKSTSMLSQYTERNDEAKKRLKEAQDRNTKETDPKRFAVTQEQERQNKIKADENSLIKEKIELEKTLISMESGESTKQNKWIPAFEKDIIRQKNKIHYKQLEIELIRKLSDETAKVDKEAEALTKYEVDKHKNKPDAESEKVMDRLINGYEHWQQIAIRTGKVEDELGAKILEHQNAMDNLLKDTAKAKGPQADNIRRSIKSLLDETVAIEINLDWKKQRFDVLDQMQEKEKTNNSDVLRSSQLLHAKGIIDDQQYLNAQLLAKQTELDIQKKYLDQKLQVMRDLNINTKDKADLLLDLEKNKNSQLANLDAAELARISDTNKKKSIERQKDLDDFKRKSELYVSELSLQVAKGDISSSDASKLGMSNELSVLNKQMVSLEDKGFNDILSVSELQQVIQELENIDNQIAIVQNKIKAYSADQSWTEGIKRGLQSYTEDAINMGKQLESTVTNAFKSMEDALTNFVTTGKMNFSDLANSIISDMIRMSVRAGITGPLGVAFSSLLAQADGGVWQNGIQKFATGAIVNSPTIFPMANGLGLMGEAGPEAIMPLTRTSSGKLGVEATGTNQSELNVEVNVINQGSQQQDAKVSNTTFDGKKYVIDVILQDVSSGGPLRGLISGGRGAY